LLIVFGFCSIQALIQSIGWLIKKKLGKTPIFLFNIFIDARYHHVKVVGDEALLQFSTIGFAKNIKKLDMLLIEEECRMLMQSLC
jgi:hypothetical protein